jgi:hypothetical protein
MGRWVWNEETIRSALEEFLRGWEVWPTWDEFEAGGAKGLREAISRIGGAEWWAREMGLPGGDRPAHGPRRWTEGRIRAELAALIGDGSTWPTRRQFDQAGRQGLREALRHYGGAERWSREMGVSLPSHRRPTSRAVKPRSSSKSAKAAAAWPKWTEQTIEAELRVFLNGRSEWPRFSEFVAAGRKGLYQAVLRHGGSRMWARRMGVGWVERTRPGVGSARPPASRSARA